MLSRIYLGFQALFEMVAQWLQQQTADSRRDMPAAGSVMRRIDSQELVPVHAVAGRRPHRHRA